MFFIVVLVILLGLIPAIIASSKGYSFGLWWIYGMALFIVALPHALMLDVGGSKATCPFCRESMNRDAVVCPHCHREMKDKTCTNCGRRLTALIDYCPGCATDLRHVHS
ncbi:MAG TPA: zinc ribbon domain-containing protein [Rhizomicrobium sp.]|jgi:predicted amidophosphoribosyltransferase|nr:zinc ribbon domain-containing protein [Rhizomicrobium sp.]